MREIFQKLKTPIIILALIFAGFIVYNTFVKKPAPTALLKTTSTTASTPESNFLPILLEVQNVTMDENLFLDPVFRALVDFSQPIVPESLGKQNPFSGTLGAAAANSSVESLGFIDTATTTNTSKTPIKTILKK